MLTHQKERKKNAAENADKRNLAGVTKHRHGVLTASSPRQLTVFVVVLTYQRPALLARTLSHFDQLAHPDGAKLIFCVVDNDAEGSARNVTEAHGSLNGALLYRRAEPRAIPIARNRAIDEAHAAHADALCFIDDDEYPDREWLVHLVRCWRETGADLVGGPVKVTPPPKEMAVWPAAINRGLAARADRKNDKAAAAAEQGRPVTVVTNNWLCDLHWQKQTGLRFDETMLVSGGSDAVFFRAASAAGATSAWCNEAVVFETITDDRLTLSYQFRRSAYQSMTNFHTKHAVLTPYIVLAAVGTSLIRLFVGFAIMVAPVYGLASLVIGVRSIGWAAGRIGALFGMKSELYK
ncbi:MAG: glycosyltransferase [Pseudomonadota bacterium]